MKSKLLEVQKKIKKYTHRTAVLTNQSINQISDAQIYFKCENFQKMGAFKMRGAINAILHLSEEQKSKGVVTHSSGNFAQAVSLSAKLLGIKADIVMPSNAPEVKKKAVAGYGGKITLSEPTLKAREEATQKIVNEKGATALHPSNDLDVIMGNATSAMELLEDHPDLDILMSPIGGGGLIAGTALAAHHFSDHAISIGAEPFAADDAYRSLKSGKIETNETADTIADGLRTILGDVNFPIIQEHLHSIIRVEESEIVEAMRLIWERMKIIIEPSCAVPLAAILREKEKFEGKKIGVILSGGNVDLGKLPF